MIPLLLVGFLLFPQEDAAKLIEKLRSESMIERDEAARKLKEMGRAAAPELEKAAKDPDGGIAALARSLLTRLRLMDTLSPDLQKAIPGIADKLAFGGRESWAEAFLQAEALLRPGSRLPLIASRDLEPLTERALAGAQSDEQKSSVFEAAARRRLRLTGTVACLENEELREAALEALRQHPSEEGIQKLREMTHHDRSDRREFALDALRRLEVRDAAADAGRLLTDPAASVRSAAARALASLRGREAAPHLVQALKDRSHRVRRNAIQELLGLFAREESKRIAEMLNDREPEIRSDAATAVGILGYRDAIPRLIELLKDKIEVRCEALRAQGMLKAKEAAPDALELLEADWEDTYVLTQFLAALAPKEARERCAALLKHEKEEVRATALAVLSVVGDASSAPGILEVLRDGTVEDRAGAAVAAGRLGLKEAIPDLIQASKSPRPRMRGEFLTALAVLESRESVPVLLACLKTDDSEVRASAITALGRLKAREAGDRIAEFLARPDEDRSAAIEAIRRIEGRDAIPRLLALLEDKDEWTCMAAMYQLERLEAWELAPRIEPLLQDREAEVRAAAAAWLARAGSRVGVRILLDEVDEDPEIWLLNALRAPEAWARLQKAKVVGKRRGTPIQKIKAFAKEAGFEMAVEEGPLADSPRWLEGGEDETDLEEPLPLGEAIWWELPTEFEMIVESDRIRLLPLTEARRFWRAWWKDGGNAVPAPASK